MPRRLTSSIPCSSCSSTKRSKMHPFFLFLLIFLLPHEILSGTAAAASCNRWCGDTTVPYPFGFSDGCPIALSCDADTSPTLPYTGGGSGTSYRVVSFNSTISTVMVSLPVSCIRSVPDVRRALSGANYGVSARTMLSVRGCHNASASSCIIPAGVISRLLDTARCDGSDASVKCVASVAPNASAGLAYRQFLRWEDVEKASCNDVLASGVCLDMVDGVLSLANEVAELAWWLNGTCVGGGGGCAANATCSDVNTPSGSVGHRCTCVAGMDGDGFLPGDGCYVGEHCFHLNLFNIP
uniref:Wall-associated receptor kinase galacturonan-binding domain-containing protein n=1 Tax=Aegilops tauschii subsp. strangulata TaxID=200361 RepID=A0A453JQ02_AEGTS